MSVPSEKLTLIPINIWSLQEVGGDEGKKSKSVTEELKIR
jgi:hypothetical protein